MHRSNSYPPRKALRTSSQARFPESAAWFDAAKLYVSARPPGHSYGRHPSSLPARTSTSACTREAPHPHISIPVLTPHPLPTFSSPSVTSRTSNSSHTHATSRSRLLSAPSRPRPRSTVLFRPTFPREDHALASLDSEWTPWDQWEGGAERSAEQSNLSTSLAGNPRAHPRAYRRRTLFCGDRDVDLRADDGTLPSLLTSLPSPRPLFTPALAGPSSPPCRHTHTLPAAYPQYLDSHAAPRAAPPTRVRLTLKTATLRPRFGWAGAWSKWARSLSHPYRTRPSAHSPAYILARVHSFTPHAYVRLRFSSPLSPSGHSRLAPSRPARARASLAPASRSRDIFVSEAGWGASVDGKAGVGMGMGTERERETSGRVRGKGGRREGKGGRRELSDAVVWRGSVCGYCTARMQVGCGCGCEGGDEEGGESGGEWSWGWNGVLIISARPLFLLGAPAQFRASGSAASSSRLVRALAYTAAYGARLLHRARKGARDGPACAGPVYPAYVLVPAQHAAIPSASRHLLPYPAHALPPCPPSAPSMIVFPRLFLFPHPSTPRCRAQVRVEFGTRGRNVVPRRPAVLANPIAPPPRARVVKKPHPRAEHKSSRGSPARGRVTEIGAASESLGARREDGVGFHMCVMQRRVWRNSNSGSYVLCMDATLARRGCASASRLEFGLRVRVEPKGGRAVYVHSAVSYVVDTGGKDPGT
ncbi:hypothetical protein C8F04DRAFT_1242215 [Mycena alexandri]|uniref:Uncharacterized protein n=1 Tax=Mycena alexandri TaxID=1745969 RepID=A0AAD6S3D2_9AGAR|nr:hypothetical protein C8F04DRAFT_1242215 [Mycena alexandri]